MTGVGIAQILNLALSIIALKYKSLALVRDQLILRFEIEGLLSGPPRVHFTPYLRFNFLHVTS